MTRTLLLRLPAGAVTLEADLRVPPQARGLVLFAHGSGSDRRSPRNRFVAAELEAAGFATLLIDLLTPEEKAEDRVTARLRFDIPLLGGRVLAAVDALGQEAATAALPLGLFGSSTGAAALIAAAEWPQAVRAVVSRGGRPDLAGEVLVRVQAPTLLIVGSEDVAVLGLNRQAVRVLAAPEKQLEVVPGAGHLFEEPGALEAVARLARDWFFDHLSSPVARAGD